MTPLRQHPQVIISEGKQRSSMSWSAVSASSVAVPVCRTWLSLLCNLPPAVGYPLPASPRVDIRLADGWRGCLSTTRSLAPTRCRARAGHVAEWMRDKAEEQQRLGPCVAELVRLARWHEDHSAGSQWMFLLTNEHHARSLQHEHLVLVCVGMPGRMTAGGHPELPHGETRCAVFLADQAADPAAYSSFHLDRRRLYLLVMNHLHGRLLATSGKTMATGQKRSVAFTYMPPGQAVQAGATCCVVAGTCWAANREQQGRQEPVRKHGDYRTGRPFVHCLPPSGAAWRRTCRATSLQVRCSHGPLRHSLRTQPNGEKCRLLAASAAAEAVGS